MVATDISISSSLIVEKSLSNLHDPLVHLLALQMSQVVLLYRYPINCNNPLSDGSGDHNTLSGTFDRLFITDPQSHTLQSVTMVIGTSRRVLATLNQHYKHSLSIFNHRKYNEDPNWFI